MVEPVSIVSRINFCFEIPRISQLHNVSSPEFLVQGIPWNVRVCKKNEEAKQYLGIYLHCAKKYKSPHWTHAASAAFKLLPFGNNQNAIEYISEPCVFDHTGTGFGFPTFIEWKRLFDVNNNYVKNDTIKFKIQIEAEPQNQMNKSELKFETLGRSCAGGCQTKFRLTVSNIKNLLAVRSPKFVLCDLPWNFTVYKDHLSNLGVRSRRKRFHNETPCKTKMVVKLLSKRANVKPIEQTQIQNILSPDCMETNRFVSWNELFKPENGFVENNSITLEVELNSCVCCMNRNASDSKDKDVTRKMECTICFESIGSQNLSCLPCGHLFCTPCITNIVKNRKICPSCNRRVTLNDLHRVHLPFIN